MTKSICFSLACLFAASAINAQVVSIDLEGSDADGYFAVVGLNQEGNQTLDGISRNPNSPKFFDYPAYVNPQQPNNIFIMYVSPYRFGLDYPDPLHPTGFQSFESVGELRPASEASLEGVTFIEAVSEDDGLLDVDSGQTRRDFHQASVGSIEFESTLVTGAGTEVVTPDQVTLILDGSDFRATNRTSISPADLPPFGIDGRSNRNEAWFTASVATIDVTGEGLTFQGGLLTSIDLVAEASVDATGGALGASAALPAKLEFAGRTFAYDGDDQFSSFFASNVRLIINRSGTINAVGVFVVPGTCPADFNGDGSADGSDVTDAVNAIRIDHADFDADLRADFVDVVIFLRIAEDGCGT